MRRPRELRRSLGGRLREPGRAFGFQRRHVLSRFLQKNVAHPPDCGIVAGEPPDERRDRPRVDRRRLALAQAVDPLGEAAAGDGREFQQLDRGRLLALEALVQHALDLPGGFAEVRKADHAAAAFQRMKTAPDGGKLVHVGRRGTACRQRGSDGGEDFVRLVEKDLQQGLVRSGRRRRTRCCWRRRGPFLEALQEKVERLLARLAALHTGRDIEAEAAQPLGQPVELAGTRHERGEHALTALEHRGGALPAKHAQRAVDLAQLRCDLRQHFLAAMAAREGIERLLHLPQVRDDLASDARAKLQRTEMLGQLRAQAGRRRAGRFAGRRGLEPPHHERDLLARIGRRSAEAVEHRLREEQGRGHFEQQEIAAGLGGARQARRRGRHRGKELRKLAVGERRGHGLQRGDALAHVGRAIRVAGQVTLPDLPQSLQLGTDVLLQSCRIRRRCRFPRRYERVERVQSLDIPQALRERRGARYCV